MKPKSLRPRQMTEQELQLLTNQRHNVEQIRVKEESQKSEEKSRYVASVYLELRRSTGTLYCDACEGTENLLVDKNSYGRNRGLLCRSCKNLLSKVGKNPTADRVAAHSKNAQLRVQDMKIFLDSKLQDLESRAVFVAAPKEANLSQLLEDRTESATKRKDSLLKQARDWERKASDAAFRAQRYQNLAAELKKEAEEVLHKMSIQITNAQSRKLRRQELKLAAQLQKKTSTKVALVARRKNRYEKKLQLFKQKQLSLAESYQKLQQYLSNTEASGRAPSC